MGSVPEGGTGIQINILHSYLSFLPGSDSAESSFEEEVVPYNDRIWLICTNLLGQTHVK